MIGLDKGIFSETGQTELRKLLKLSENSTAKTVGVKSPYLAGFPAFAFAHA